MHNKTTLLLSCLVLCACQGRTHETTPSVARPGLSVAQEARFESLPPGTRPPAAERLTASLTWSEAGQERRLWIEPELLLAFGADQTDLGARVPGARLQSKLGPTVRLWRLPPGVAANELLPSLADAPELALALRYGPGSSGPLVGLPGGVLLTLADGADPVAVEAALGAAGETVLARWELEKGGLLHLAGPGGPDCLRQMERLAGFPGIAVATPNLWIERASQ
jgi:hypothetical protein